MYLLFLMSFLTLLAGPIVVQLASHKQNTLRFIDAFFISAIIGLLGVEVVPHSVMVGGWLSVVALFIGIISPFMLQSFSHLKECEIPNTIVAAALIGLLSHALLDGFALGTAHLDHGAESFYLGLAVVLHRLPEGIAVWRVSMVRFSVRFYCFALFLIVAASSLGFFYGPDIVNTASENVMVIAQAFMAGVLFHVLFHRTHFHHHDEHSHQHHKRWHVGTVVGVVLGIVSVAGLFLLHGLEHVH